MSLGLKTIHDMNKLSHTGPKPNINIHEVGHTHPKNYTRIKLSRGKVIHKLYMI